MTHSPLAILFDLDGTLVDTAPDLLASLNAVLTRAGHRPVKPTELRNMVGHGVRALFERAFKETGTPVSPEDLTRYSDEFMAHYRENIARESRPFPGVPETLKRLADAGAKLGVCSNKPQELTDLLLAQLDLARHFGAVYGGGKAAHNKPAPRPCAGAGGRARGFAGTRRSDRRFDGGRGGCARGRHTGDRDELRLHAGCRERTRRGCCCRRLLSPARADFPPGELADLRPSR